MLIPRWVKIAAVLAVLVALFGAFQAYEAHVFKQGYDKAAGEAAARELTIKADADKLLADATKTALDRERKLQTDLAAADDLRFKETQDHEKAIADLRARARAGDERLRVAVNAGSLQQCPAGANSAVTGRPGDERRADLMPGTVDALFGIAGRVTSLVRRYDAVVERYNRARETCNAVDTPAP